MSGEKEDKAGLIPPEQIVRLNEALIGCVQVLRGGGYSDLAISTMLVRHVAHVLGDMEPERKVIR